MKRRDFLGRFAAGLAAAGLAPHARAEPFAVETIDLEPVDTRRKRTVPLRLHLPRAGAAGVAGGAGRVPLVVFSHGIGGSRMGYSYLGRHWAAHGVASLHVQHVGSNRSLWGAGNVFSLVSRLQQAAQESEAIDRVHDLRFALDHVLEGSLATRFDAARVLAAGHSYGANTTLLAAGAQVFRDGRVVDLREPRVQAAIVMSAPPFYGETGEMSRILAPVRVPSLHITCTEDDIKIPGYSSGLPDRVAVFEAVGGARKTLAVFQGGSHSIFTDRSGPGGPELNQRVKAATRELTLGFLRSVFEAEHQGLQEWPQRHAALLARYVPGPLTTA
ncbi:MAG: alpha/beta hydrolase family protein [Rubrivivax sp.]